MTNQIYQTELSNFLNEFFDKTDGLVSAKNLQELLVKNNLSFNKTSIYRQLKLMEQEGRIQSFQTQQSQVWEKRYLSDHAHFSCRTCNQIVCIQIDPKYINQISPKNKITNVSFVGFCQQCLSI